MCPLTPILVPKIVIKSEVPMPGYWGAPPHPEPVSLVSVVAVLGCQLDNIWN